MSDVTGSYISYSFFSSTDAEASFLPSSSSFFESPSGNAGNFHSGSLFNSSTGNAAHLLMDETITVVTGSGGSSTKTYLKRGWYPIGATFEYWRTTSVTAGPPSGHTLLDVCIVSTYSS